MQVPDPLQVVHVALRVHVVLGRPAVLGDVQRQPRRLLGYLEQDLVQAVGVDEPTHGGPLQVVRPVLDHARHSAAGRFFVPSQVGGVAGAQEDGRVVVDAEEVQPLADHLQVAVGDQVGRREHGRRGVRRVPAAQYRFEVDAVHHRLGDHAGGFQVGQTIVAKHPDRMQVQGDAHLRRARVAQCPGGQAMAEQEVMRGGSRGLGVPQAGGVLAVAIAVVGHDLRFVQRDPTGHPVTEGLRADRGVLGEPVSGITYRPAALVLELLGQVPVVQRGRGRDAVLGELVQQRSIVVQALGVGRAAAAGLHARPGDGEPVGLQTERGHQRDVLSVTVIGVAGDVAGVPAADVAGRMAEGVPHRRAPAVGARRPFDLVSGRRRSPGEACGKSQGAVRSSHQPLPCPRPWTVLLLETRTIQLCANPDVHHALAGRI